MLQRGFPGPAPKPRICCYCAPFDALDPSILAPNWLFVSWAGRHRSPLKFFRFAALLALAALAVWPQFQTRAERLEEGAAALQRGPAARVRARLEQGTALLLGDAPDANAAVAAADGALAELALLAHEVDAPGGSALALHLVDELAAQASELRAFALGLAEPLPSGFRGEFLEHVASGAVLGDWRYGVPASITMAQAILESGWGKVAPGYNLFGMKGEGTAGSEVHRVVEYSRGKRSVRKASFRSYRSVAESITDHARVLGTSERYAAARAAGDDALAYAKSLQGKYATDPHYAKKLMDLSERYNLGRFDWRPTAPTAEPPVALVQREWTAFLDSRPDAAFPR